jgi:hypothetical protein
MEKFMNNKRSQQRLGRILHWLAWVLGVAELGIMSRAGEWLGYEQIGTLGFVYFLALMAGVVIGPRLPMHTANVVGLSVLLAALPIVGIGLLVQGVIAPKAMFTTVCVLWAASGAGAGMLDNAQSSAAVNYSPRGGTSSVAMLGTRHLGTLSASAATAVAVTYGIDVGWHYVALGAILIVPFLGRRAVPDVHRTDVGVAAPGGRSVSAWVLFPMGLYLTASVLPISASWAWINPIMRELHAPDILSASALSVFVVAQAIASFVYYRRSLKHSASRLVRGGLVVSAVGVVALVLVVTHGKVQILPAEWLNYVAWGAFALIGWGVAPLPMVVAQAANRLPMKLRITSRISRMVALQCLLVAAGNYALGRLAELWTGAQAYAAMSVMCVVILFLGIRITSRRS